MSSKGVYTSGVTRVSMNVYRRAHKVKQMMRPILAGALILGTLVVITVYLLDVRPVAVVGDPDSTSPAPVVSDTNSEVRAAQWSFEHVIVDENPPATYRMNDIQIGDIDGDGLPDVWTSGRGAGTNAYQMVWYKNPTWTRYEIAKGDYKYGNLGDFDGDGDLDVVAGQDNDSRVYWFENTGNPEQKDWPRYYLGVDDKPDLLHVGDIDGDGRLDVVYTYKDEVGWAKNPQNPQNSWPTYTIWSGGRRTGGTLADIDQDGDFDILYGNAWFENPLPGGDPTQGGQWIMRVIDSGWPTEARGAVGDLNGDGKPDVVLSGEESSAGVVWYTAPADLETGTWIRQEVVSSGYEGVHSLALADFDQDGDLDIFAAEMHHGDDPDKVAVFESVGIGSNTWVEHVLATFGSHMAKIGDLDGNGYPDIVGKNYEAGATPLRVDMWINNVANSALPVDQWQRHVVDSNRPWRAVFVDGGDVNGDGLPDIVTGGWWYQNPGSPDGVWTRHATGGVLYNMAVVHDLDGDGDLDILGTKGKVDSNEFVWAENDGNGSFTLHTNLANADGDFLQGARAAQIIPGGNVEVVLSWHNDTSTQMFRIPSPATDPWLWEVVSPTTNGEQIAVGDIDGDGDLDIHLGTKWLRNDGGVWTTVNAFTLGDPDADPDRVEIADIDGDGDRDVVIGAEHTNLVVWAEAPPDPEDPWTEHVISTDILAMSLDVADVDQDGDIDIVVGEHNNSDPTVGRVIIYRNEESGKTWSTFEIDSGLEHHDGTRFIDIDDDGDLDILSTGWTHSQVVLYENKAGRSTLSRLPLALKVALTSNRGSVACARQANSAFISNVWQSVVGHDGYR